ncbi:MULTISPECIES: aspartyl protease family protein [unclassified Rhodanobacter]|uniref:Aspartyl protease family protein n=1 Tax=Rhodanobacter humi TaxID=1888173 RepID=A0ABV4AS17_9GAMM
MTDKPRQQGPQHQCLTVTFDGRSNVIPTQCEVMVGFDPLNPPAQQQSHLFNAIWDTGATQTVITQAVVDKLGLLPTGLTRANTANGEHLTETFFVAVKLPNGVGFPGMTVSRGNISGIDMLIGMDIICAGDFAITNVGGKTVMSYRVPSHKPIDFVREHNMGAHLIKSRHKNKRRR